MRRPGLVASLFVLVFGLAAASSPQTASVVEYYHLDGLGSVRAVSNAAGVLVAGENRDYLPYGEELCGTVPCSAVTAGQSRRFAGKERDAETGLDYFGARHYGAGIGRFTTTDPVVDIQANQADPQRWNRYAYGLNNPFRYVDPDGKYARDVHFYATYRLAVWVGLSMTEAYLIARANQGVDDNPLTSPVPNPAQAIEETRGSGGGIVGMILASGFVVRAQHHFVTPERLAQMREEAFSSRDPNLFGIYLHALQDSFSHQRGQSARDGEPYEPLLGHVFVSEALKVDDPRWRPILWKRMVEKTIAELSAWRDATVRPSLGEAFTTRPPDE